MQSSGAAASRAAVTASARAQASRINGARSRGPKTADGKARSAQNALRHGMRAQRFAVLPDEDAAEYAAHEAALMADLAPEGALQAILARRVAAAAWRLERADRIEAEMFEAERYGGGSLGKALIRDGHGGRAFQTLLRYRGAAQAELWRSLRTLKALQAEAAADAVPVPDAAPAPKLVLEPERPTPAVEPAPAPLDAHARGPGEPGPRANPIEPGRRGMPRESGPERDMHAPERAKAERTRDMLKSSAAYSLARTLT